MRGWGSHPGAGSGARAGSAAVHPGGPAGGRAGGPCGAPLSGSPRTPGRSRPARPPPLSPARLATEPSFSRRTPALAVPARLLFEAFVCSSPARASSRRPRRGTRVPRTRRAGSLGPGLGRATYPGGQCCPILENQSQPPGSHVDETQEVCCRSVLTASLCCARGLPPAPVSPTFHSCLCLGEKQEPPFH